VFLVVMNIPHSDQVPEARRVRNWPHWTPFYKIAGIVFAAFSILYVGSYFVVVQPRPRNPFLSWRGMPLPMDPFFRLNNPATDVLSRPFVRLDQRLRQKRWEYPSEACRQAFQKSLRSIDLEKVFKASRTQVQDPVPEQDRGNLEHVVAPFTIEYPLGEPVDCIDYLHYMGGRLDCHFTLEYRGFSITVQPTLQRWGTKLTNEAGVSSISLLVSKLRRDLPTFNVVGNSKRPNVIHIVERALEEDPDYVMNKRLSLKYSGPLAGYQTATSKFDGLANTVGRTLRGIKTSHIPAEGYSFSFVIGDDIATEVSINATNETVRSIFTECIPLGKYKAVLWQAVKTAGFVKVGEGRGETHFEVFFLGQRETETK